MRVQIPVRLLAGLAVLLAGGDAVGQGTFQNLDFESATLVPIGSNPHNGVQFSSAFPGWTAQAGGVQLTVALYDNFYLDHSGISIIDRQSTFGSVIDGNFAALLQAGLSSSDPSGTISVDTTLGQTGLIPAGTESLQFKAYASSPSDSFDVTLGGQTLSLRPLASGSNFTVYGADIHAWAGQTAELAFTAIAERPHVSNNYLFLDSIEFSEQSIPEPGVFGFSALGALLFGWRALRRR